MLHKATKINQPFVVQFEVEFDDAPSDNVTLIVHADSEEQALLRAKNDPAIIEPIVEHYKPKKIYISPQIAWKRQDESMSCWPRV